MTGQRNINTAGGDYAEGGIDKSTHHHHYPPEPAPPPAGFVLYALFDNRYAVGALDRLAGRIVEATRQITEQPLVLVDRLDLWDSRALTVLVPVLTPAFFHASDCRDSAEQFLVYEQQQGRDDLIVPIYYATHPPLTAAQRPRDPLVAALRTRSRIDWRALHESALSSPEARRAIAEVARQIAAALAR